MHVFTSESENKLPLKSLVQFLLIFAISTTPCYRSIDPSPGLQSKITTVSVFKGLDKQHQESCSICIECPLSQNQEYYFDLIPTGIVLKYRSFGSNEKPILLNRTGRAPPQILSVRQ